MTREEIMEILDIESDEDFMYFDQFAALMETEEEIDYDMFVELLMMMETETLKEVLSSFFEDMIKGIPDDNTDLYSAVQTVKDALLSLSALGQRRSFGFFADELFKFREWYRMPGIVVCRPESGGREKLIAPYEALILFREEKLSGEKYSYDFSSAMPQPPDEYALDLLAEMSENYSMDDAMDREEMMDLLPDEYDPETYDPNAYGADMPIDPYVDGFIDRYAPVIDSEDYDLDDD